MFRSLTDDRYGQQLYNKEELEIVVHEWLLEKDGKDQLDRSCEK